MCQTQTLLGLGVAFGQKQQGIPSLLVITWSQPKTRTRALLTIGSTARHGLPCPTSNLLGLWAWLRNLEVIKPRIRTMECLWSTLGPQWTMQKMFTGSLTQLPRKLWILWGMYSGWSVCMVTGRVLHPLQTTTTTLWVTNWRNLILIMKLKWTSLG